MFTVLDHVGDDAGDHIGTRQFFHTQAGAEQYAEAAALVQDRDMYVYAGRIMRPGNRRPLAAYLPGDGWRRPQSM